MKMYALQGRLTGELLTYGGHVLLHTNRDELQFLFPRTKIVEVEDTFDFTMMVEDHPDLQHVNFPLVRTDFRVA